MSVWGKIGKQERSRNEETRKQLNYHQNYPEDTALVALLKACTKQKDLVKGSKIHADILKRGLLETNIYIGNALVNLYAKCGELAKAKEVFDKLPIRDVVSWNALIAGYAQTGHCEEAINCFERMKCEDLAPNAVTLSCVLKACGSLRAADKGREIHAEIVREGLLGKDILLGTGLVDMYARCGALAKAQEVFDKLPVRDVVSWNALITGYAQRGHGKEALNCFEQMQQDGLTPNATTFVCILKSCGSIGAADKGKEVHAQLLQQGLHKTNILVGTALVDMYSKFGDLKKAQESFDELLIRNVVSWTTLIAGYVQHGHGEEALECFERMQSEGLSPNPVTFVCILKACGNLGAAEKGKEIHAQIVRERLLEKDNLVGNALLDMYVKCGALRKAQGVFDELHIRDVVSWNTLIAGYAQHGNGEEALSYYERMQQEGLSPNAITYLCILKACGSLEASKKGKEIHAEIVRGGFLKIDSSVGNALVDMYVKCGVLEKAQEVLNELPLRDVVSWTALIAGYAQHGHGQEALNCFERMQQEGVSPNTITYVCILKACGSIGAVDKGKEIHAEIVREGLLESHILVGTALVDMYVKCGALEKAQEVFDNLPVQDKVSWNVLIAGYSQHGCGEEALTCFECMLRKGLSPSAVTFVCVLKACSSIGAADKGKEIHAEIVREGLLEEDVLVGNALVDMYAKCGELERAQEAFDKLPVQTLVPWTALITGYAQLGMDASVFDLFNKMIGEGVEPDVITFNVVLNACSRSGLLEKGQIYFDTMSTTYGITPTLDHYTCMVDIFGRAGYFKKAVSMIKRMPIFDHLPVWTALLSACQKWGNVKLGRWAFERAVQLDDKDVATYVSMSNIYAAAAMQEEADKIEAMKVKNKAWKKKPTC